jgi:hypothetical protein
MSATQPAPAPEIELSEPQRRVLAELERLERQQKTGCVAATISQDEIDQLQARIDAAQLAVLLSSGPEEANRIFEYVPAHLTGLLVGERAKTIEEAVRLVAANLDWYLEPPRRLWRSEWRQLGWCAAGMLFCTIAAITNMVLLTMTNLPRWITSNPLTIFLPPLLIIVIWGSCFGDAQRKRWLLALLAHVRDVYGLPALAALPPQPARPRRDDTPPGKPWGL